MEYFKFEINLMTIVALVLGLIAISIRYYMYKESLSLSKNTQLILNEVVLLIVLFVVVPFVLVSPKRTTKNGFKFNHWWYVNYFIIFIFNNLYTTIKRRLIGISLIVTLVIIVIKYFYEKNKGNSNYLKVFFS